MDFKKIKIIIWDLDDTFWSGTLSEGGVSPIKENIELLKSATRHGVVNSICSKNTYDVTVLRLQEMELLDYFVFPSIDWTPKGERIKRILKVMGLRPQNTLFLDDNPQNLSEALHYSPDLMTGGPELIPDLLSYFGSEPENDPKQKRLNQYKILEKKEEAKEEYSSNDDFLYACNLRVEMDENCESQLDRIAELVQRANQLNYTKVRSSKEELISLLKCENIKAGCVSVKDKFGDYGMVGFYAIDKKDNRCVHFLFSCRTIGQGVEQYVYAKLGYPKLTVVGEVISMVTTAPAPQWINQQSLKTPLEDEKMVLENKLKVLFKGPCDLQGLTKYIEGSCDITGEFTYVGANGIPIVSHNHSASICGLVSYKDDEKEMLIHENPFMDDDYYKSDLFKTNFDVVVLSSVLECNVALYRRKGTNLLLPFGRGMYPLTDENNFQIYEDELMVDGKKLVNREYLNWFRGNYEFVNKGEVGEYIDRMDFILDHLPLTTKLCVLLGSELKYQSETRPWMIGRELQHKLFNDSLKQWAERHKGRVWLLSVNNVVKKQEDYEGSINHYKVNVYYKLALEVIKVLNEMTGHEIMERSSRWKMIPDLIYRKTRHLISILLPNRVFSLLRKINRRL